MHWKRLAQRKLREVLELLEDLDDEGLAELGEAFKSVEDVGVAIDQPLQRREVEDG